MKTEHHQRRNKTFPSAVVCESLTPAEFTHRVSGFSQTPKQHLLTMWVRRPRQLVLWTERREKSREGGRHSDKQHKPGLVFVFSSEPDRWSILGADADMEKLKISDINTLANITRFLQWSLKMCLSKHISMLWGRMLTVWCVLTPENTTPPSTALTSTEALNPKCGSDWTVGPLVWTPASSSEQTTCSLCPCGLTAVHSLHLPVDGIFYHQRTDEELSPPETHTD